MGRDYPAHTLGIPVENYLVRALDHESRARYAEAAEAITLLAAAVEAAGGRYVLVLDWMQMQPIGLQRLAGSLRPDQVALLPFTLFTDAALRLSPTDGHWSRAGHEAVGAYLYALTRTRGLLPGLRLQPWSEADAILKRWTAQAQRELQDAGFTANATNPPRLANAIVTTALDATTASQLNGGLFREGAGPYLSVTLARAGGDRLRISGAFLDDPALAHATVTVSVEEFTLQRLPCQPGGPLVVDAELPAAVRGRDYLNVRLECDDFVYAGEDLRTPLSLRVDRLAVERGTLAPMSD